MADTLVPHAQRNSASLLLQETWIGRYNWLNALKRGGRIQERGGDRIEHEYVIDDSSGYSFGPDSEVEPTQKYEVVKQVFDWGAHARDDKQRGWDMENQGAIDRLTSGTLLDIYKTRVKLGHSSYFKSINERLWRGTGTPHNSADGQALDFLGIPEFVPDDPTTGTIGELSRATYDFLQSQQLDGASDGESGSWSNDCWELLLRLNIECADNPATWSDRSTPDFWFTNAAATADIIRLAYAQNTNVGANVENIESVGGVYVEIEHGLQGNRVYALNSSTWCYFRPPGIRSMIELDIRSELERRMNLKDTLFIWKARGCHICKWAPQNGVITNAVAA